MEAYKAQTGYYIQQSSGGDLKIDKPTNGVDLTDYLTSYQQWTIDGTIDANNKLIDAYGKAFWYRCPGYHNRGSFDIESAGPDGKFGYSDNDHNSIDDADETADNIKNWK